MCPNCVLQDTATAGEGLGHYQGNDAKNNDNDDGMATQTPLFSRAA